MYKYRNKKTGAVLETTCKISGGDWEEVVAKKSSKKKGESNGDETSEGKSKDPEDE